MSSPAEFDTSKLRFARTHPAELADRFPEIQALRQNFYRREFASRPEEQVNHYVGRLTVAKWSNPNSAVGNTAVTGQRRNNPQVVAAFDIQTDELVGFTYAAENVSSKYERWLSRHVPSVIAGAVGAFERAQKLRQNRYYVWGSEYVHNNEHPGLVPILGALMVEGFDTSLPGTWYPWDEQADLKETLTSWGYVWDKGEPSIEDFGPDSESTKQERWFVPRLAIAEMAIHEMPGIVEALELARANMTVST